MKPQLQRITTTLERLEQNSSPPQKPRLVLPTPDQTPPSQTTSSATSKPLQLPKFKPIKLSNHRNGENPGLALSLLKEMENQVEAWQEELKKILEQIQAIYLEGPIVDGWLESEGNKLKQEETEISSRKQEIDALLNYVPGLSGAKVSYQTPRPGYQLCGLDDNGQYWSQPCPPEELPSVSMAIARYQKLRQLLNRKQDLEYRLKKLAEALIALHGNFQEHLATRN